LPASARPVLSRRRAPSRPTICTSKSKAWAAPRWSSDREREPPDRLVYLLDHEYTQRGLAWNRLKNTDTARAAAELTQGGHGTTVYQAVPVPDGVRYETAVGR
jgi:hypothetical protein